MEPLLPFIAAARAAHGEFAADDRALVVDGAAGGVGIDRSTPTVFTLGQRFHAALVAMDQPLGHVVLGHQYDGETAADGFTGRTLHAGIYALGVGIDALGVGGGKGIHSSV